MTSYFDCKKTITKSGLFKGLLGHGLFADKLPDFLTSEDFYAHIKAKTFPYDDAKPKDYVRYSNLRNINIPRPLSIPEPFAYANQVKVISESWYDILKHFKRKTENQKFKVSRIHIRKRKNSDSLFKMNYKNFQMDGNPEDKLIIKAKYIAHADIATCFPSIYSHSISWALIGKTQAKLKSGPKFKDYWTNKLDFYTRNLKYGETNGLLIGPHSSNLISEIILTSVDRELIKKKYSFYRNVDDYMCFVSSYEEAEKFFIDISEELKKYELSLNSKKSKISQLPQATVTNWVTKLNHFNFRDEYILATGQKGVRLNELKGFLDFAVEAMIENNSDAAILNYAIKILSKKHLGKSATEYYFSKIHHLSLLYPYLTQLLEEYVFQKPFITTVQIENISNDLYEIGLKKKNFEVCAYAVYFSLKYKFKLSCNSIEKDSIKSNDCIFLLISYLYCKRNFGKAALLPFKIIARKFLLSDFDRYWLFCYEILGVADLTGNYKLLKRAKISFIQKNYI